jgi:hypothetical protein
VLFALHQLEGSASEWWDTYVNAHEEPQNIGWQEFRTAFHTHHVPQGVIKLKKKEFQDMRQGSILENEYVTRFTQLSCYAPNNVDTDEKKQDCFLNRLNDGLANALEARNYENFQDMVNMALVLENHRGIMNHKRKQECQGQSSKTSRPRIGMPSAEPIKRTPQ